MDQESPYLGVQMSSDQNKGILLPMGWRRVFEILAELLLD